MSEAKGSELPVHSLYLLHTDTNGREHVQEHWVWDSKRFLAEQAAICDGLNDAVQKNNDRDRTKLPALAKVSVLTERGYLDRKGGRRYS